MVKTIQEKLELASKIEMAVAKEEKLIGILKEEMFKELNERFPLFLNRRKNQSPGQNYKGNEIDDEISILLRSMLKGNEIIKVPAFRIDSEGIVSPGREYYLTRKHGLKYPRCWTSYSFLPLRYSPDRTCSMEGLVWRTNWEGINFIALKDNKLIDQIKLNRFQEFVQEILKLWSFFVQTEKMLDKKDSKFQNLQNLSDYSALQNYKEYIDLIDQIELIYFSYVEKINIFMSLQETLLTELREFNKPFRVFLTLKNTKE